MRTRQTLALLVVLFSAGAAKAAEITTAQSGTAPDKTTALPLLGVMMDAGVPDGAQLSLVLRPTKWLRTSIGGGYNLISKGVRAGVSVLPFGRGPSLTVEGGRFFEGNANGAAKLISGVSSDNALLERVGYDYANAHLGLDIGYKRVTFYIHGGMSYIRGTVHNLNQELQTAAAIDGVSQNGTEVQVKQDPTFKAIAPSAKLGLIVYLW
jgi:hypothetical protein